MMPILSLSASSQDKAHVHSYSIPAGNTGHQTTSNMQYWLAVPASTQSPTESTNRRIRFQL